MEDVGIFMAIFLLYGQMVSIFFYFTAKWYILWPFGIFYGHLVHFVGHRKIWQPWRRPTFGVLLLLQVYFTLSLPFKGTRVRLTQVFVKLVGPEKLDRTCLPFV
jgi:hypothetical protein